MTPSASLPIAWGEINQHEFTDGLGRVFMWTGLKGKKIYLCGHGAHIYRDGYTTVPAGTTVNFYQVYGVPMTHHRLMKFLAGGEQWHAERSFEAGKSCPNMTLFDDEIDLIAPTYEAINGRLKNAPDKNDHYAFFCNVFRGLPRYAPVQKPDIPPHPFVGKQILKLSEILLRLPGNTIEWACCQDTGMERNQYMKDGTAVTLGKLREVEAYDASEASSAAMKEKLKLFSAIVQAGLKAASAVKKEIAAGYNPRGPARSGETHVEGTISSTVHGSAVRAQYGYLNRRRAGTPVGTRDEVAKWRDQIRVAIEALGSDPQPQPPFEHAWASETLRRGLVTCDSFLAAFAQGNASNPTG